MKYIGYILSVCVIMLTSCAQELDTPCSPENGGDGTTHIRIVPEGMSLVETRAAGDAGNDADSRIEHVAIFAFNADGDFVTGYEQVLEHPDHEVSLILPQNEGQLTMHAVCNYTDMPEKISKETELNDIVIEIAEADGAFDGSMVMHGKSVIS